MSAHIISPYLKNPQHPVSVHLVGAGGTGSQVLAGLARIHTSLQALDHPGLHVTVFDPDEVTEANVGRQLFSSVDIGQNKAAVLVTRINRFYGLGWQAAAMPYLLNPMFYKPNILLSCVDTAQTRIDIGKLIRSTEEGREPYAKGLYWLDFGNSQKTGQIVLGSLIKDKPLRAVDEMFDLSIIKEDDQGPSCSLAEALSKQDLFINSILAQFGCDIIWKLFREKELTIQGAFVNLENMNVRPININKAAFTGSN